MMRVVVAGTSDFGLPSFDALRTAADVSLVGVISQPARPVGRHHELTPTPVAQWATTNDFPLHSPENWKSVDDLAALKNLAPDLVVVASYGVIVPSSFLAIPTFGCLNLHASLLPAYRGASPIAAAILHGDQETGVTFMKMDVGLDTGPIYRQVPCPVLPTDTTPLLTTRLANLAADHIIATVSKIASGEPRPSPQPSSASITKKIRRVDGLADWSSATMLERKIRAYTPWPGVWTTWNGTTLKLLAGQVVQGSTEAPGMVVALKDGGWAIACLDGLFVPTAVQFAGKQPQPAQTVPGSYPQFIGATLGA